MPESQEQVLLRSENVSKVVEGFALMNYTMKQLVTVIPSSSWKETYFRETSTELTASGGRSIEGIAPLAQFPHVEETWTRHSSRHKKFGAETAISIEDVKTNDVDVLRRHLLRVARAIAKSVDDEIYDALSADAGLSTASTAAWDAGSGQDPIKDILVGIRKIKVSNYKPDFLVLSPTDEQTLITWLISTKGASIPNWSSERVTSGVVGTFLGLNLLVSNSVDADECLVLASKDCATWKEAVPLTTETILDPGVKYTIRSYEMGVIQVTNPNAIHKTTNTVA